MELQQTEQEMVAGFKELRTKLFDFSRNDNNTHLRLVKREYSAFEEAMGTLKAHYEYAESKFSKLEVDFKGKEHVEVAVRCREE